MKLSCEIRVWSELMQQYPKQLSASWLSVLLGYDIKTVVRALRRLERRKLVQPVAEAGAHPYLVPYSREVLIPKTENLSFVPRWLGPPEPGFFEIH